MSKTNSDSAHASQQSDGYFVLTPRTPRTGRTLQPTLTPDSSISNQATPDFWDDDEQNATPDTPITPPSSKLLRKEELSPTSNSPCLRKSVIRLRTEAYDPETPSSQAEEKDPFIKVEEDDDSIPSGIFQKPTDLCRGYDDDTDPNQTGGELKRIIFPRIRNQSAYELSRLRPLPHRQSGNDSIKTISRSLRHVLSNTENLDHGNNASSRSISNEDSSIEKSRVLPEIEPVCGSLEIAKPEQYTRVKLEPSSSNTETVTEVTEKTRKGTTDQALVEEFANILPFDIQTRLSRNKTRCIALLVNGSSKRCKSKFHQSFEVALGKLESMKEHRNNRDYEGLLERVEELIKLTLCGSHQRSAKRRITKLWTLVRAEVQPNVLESSPSSDLSAFLAWTEALCGPDMFPNPAKVAGVSQGLISDKKPSTLIGTVLSIQAILKFRATSQLKLEQRRTDTERRSAVSQTVATVNIPAIPFEAYQSMTTKSLFASAAVIREMMKTLTQRELDNGFIYTFGSKNYSGYVKIGVTGRDPESRLKEWCYSCKEDFKLHASFHSELVEIPHAYRVEKLIHAELKDFRAKIPHCKGCDQSHKEWFKVSEDVAKKVYQRWEKWIQTAPYVRYVLPDKQVEWRFKNTCSEDIMNSIIKPDKPDQQTALQSCPREKNCMQGPLSIVETITGET